MNQGHGNRGHTAAAKSRAHGAEVSDGLMLKNRKCQSITFFPFGDLFFLQIEIRSELFPSSHSWSVSLYHGKDQ